MQNVLEIRDVTVVYSNGKRALDGVSFAVRAGECFALVGESGCGKSTLARAALGVLTASAKTEGVIFAGQTDVFRASERELKQLRGLVVGFVGQDPFSACNPLASVGDFISEAWRVHSLAPPVNVVEDALENLGIGDPRGKLRQYPFEWSGGMLQRAGIAAAAAHLPKLIIADEPTSALDAELNENVLAALKSTHTAVLLITHDLRLVERFADRVAVMSEGKIVETGSVRDVFERPQNEYTRQLLEATRPAHRETPEISETAATLLETKELSHYYAEHQIVERLDLKIEEGAMIGICGASGCGKSTLLRLLMTIETPRAGEIHLGGELASCGGTQKLGKNARNGFVMPVFQDAFASLDARWPLWRIITEPLTAKHRDRRPSKNEMIAIAGEKLREVGLGDLNPDARPGELSIGQCQRVAIARALTAGAKIIAADEPTSSLDVISGERIMGLFAEAAGKGAAVVIVSHDKNLLKRWCHRVFALAEGKLQNYRDE